MNYLNPYIIAVLVASTLGWMGAFTALLFTPRAGYEGVL